MVLLQRIKRSVILWNIKTNLIKEIGGTDGKPVQMASF